jgi:hypothetical protein
MKKIVETSQEMTGKICDIIIKPEIHPWVSLGVILQSTIVISAASGITLDTILEHINKILTDPIAIAERNRIEVEYKKEYSKNKTHLNIASKRV